MTEHFVITDRPREARISAHAVYEAIPYPTEREEYRMAEGGQVTITFRLMPDDKDSAYTALKLAKAMIHKRQPITISDDQPPMFQLGPCSYREASTTLAWLHDIQWPDASMAEVLQERLQEIHRDSPHDGVITQHRVRAGLEAFDDALSGVCNVYQNPGGRSNRVHHYNQLRQVLADPNQLVSIANEPYYERNIDAHRFTHMPHQHLSARVLEIALPRIAHDFVQKARVLPTYSDKRRYVGPKVEDPDTHCLRDAHPPGDSERDWHVRYVLKNVEGISYGESVALLKAIEAYEGAIRKKRGLEGVTSLERAYGDLARRQRNGDFEPSETCRDLPLRY